MRIALGEIAERVGGRVEGDAGVEVSGICSIDDLREGHVVFLEKGRDAARIEGKPLAGVICAPDAQVKGHNLIRAEAPRIAFAQLLALFHPQTKPEQGIHPAAFVHESAVIGRGVSIGACAVVEADAHIGDDAVIHPSAYIGKRASVGNGCVIYPMTCVLHDCVLGDRVILHSGVVIGADGFGYVKDGERHRKIPQVGNVVIEDDVEIGANSAVDRATIGSTVIGSGTKIDNQVQVGHNVRVGRNCIICGQAGIAGSCIIGDSVTIAGQAGISDHITIGANAIIGGSAGVITNVPDNSFYSGFPARPHREAMKLLSSVQKLPEMEKKIDEILRLLRQSDKTVGK
ncbi:MAG: UDP-3-O-(3-hydroxymyristoyl)glucosamine N-acyltransferase [bacterium]